MLGIDKKVSTSRNRDVKSSSRSRKNSSQKRLVLKKKDSEKKDVMVVSKSGKLKIAPFQQKLY